MKWGHPLNSAPGTANPKFSTAKYEPFCGGTATTSARGVRRRSYIDNLCRLTEIEVGSVGADDFEVANVSESRLFEYDDLGRLLKTKQSSASGGSVYGQAVYGVNAYGASGSASMEERSYVYDSLDRVQMVTFEDGKTMEYFYDFEGNVTEVVENASGTSKTTQFSYYGDNRLYQVTYVRASGNQVFTYDYDPGGRPEKLTYPASTGIVAEFEGPNNEPGWDGNGQLKHLCYKKGLDTIRRFAFEYDLAGNRISQLDVVDIAQPPTRRAVEWVYGYDWLDRLESVKKREATTVAGLALEPLQLTSMYQYDAADNRIEFKVPNLQQPELTELTETFTYSYDDADNILSISKAVGTGSANEIEAFTSDADGNLKTRTSGGVTTTYTWNDFNRLAAISTSDNSKKQSHTFGVNGFRRKKKDKNDVETTEYAAGLATAVSKAQAGDTITYLMGHRLMGFERQSDGAMFWNICDALSTVRDVVNSSGTVVASYEFSEYGQRISSAENGVSSQKTFVGGLFVQDEVTNTGLLQMGHRFYEPGVLGRFLNRDPIGFQGGGNLFEYAGNSPVGMVDPLGLEPGFVGISAGLDGAPDTDKIISNLGISVYDAGVLSSGEFATGIATTQIAFLFFGHNYYNNKGIKFSDRSMQLSAFMKGRPESRGLPKFTILVGCNTAHDAPNLSPKGGRFFLGFNDVIDGTAGAAFLVELSERLGDGVMVGKAVEGALQATPNDFSVKLAAKKAGMSPQDFVQNKLIKFLVIKGNTSLKL